jgi:pyrroloquinoline quinone biosynthesis protein D
MTPIAEADIPRLARGVRLRDDQARGRTIVLAPERLFVPDDTALAVLTLLDGQRSAGDVIDALAAQYDAPRAEIAADVLALLAELAERGVVAR